MKSATSIVLMSLSAALLLFVNHPTFAAPKNTQLPAANTATSKTITIEKQADAIIENIIDAINNKDADSLAPYLIRQDYALDFAKAAINDYKTFFKAQNIAGFQRLGKSPTRPNTFLYKIFNQNGLSKTISVSFQQKQPRVDDEFFTYSAQAKGMLTRFINSIKNKDAQKLARVLTPDDVDYPVSAARQIIANYESRFDPETLKFKFKGLRGKGNYFVYTLYGFKNGKPVQHEVSIIHGDGLVGLQDYLLPKIKK